VQGECAGSTLEPIHGTGQVAMQHMLKGTVCPSKANIAPYGQVLASETVKQRESSLRFVHIDQTK
jgi:hypothetical protein